MYAETGQVCKIGGVYKCFGHPDFRIKMKVDDIFPKCAKDKPHDALWILMKDTATENLDSNAILDLSS